MAGSRWGNGPGPGWNRWGETLMKTLLIVYHSQSGSTRRLARSVQAGAEQEEGVAVVLREALEADSEDLGGADAVLFGTPENFGDMSGGLKNFFDRTYYPLEPRQDRKSTRLNSSHVATSYAVFC